jgi:hypothetical protein
MSMNEFPTTWKAFTYAFGGAVIASCGVLLAGACVFGFELARWEEWEGRVVGVVAATIGVAGTFVGLLLARREDARPANDAVDTSRLKKRWPRHSIINGS